MSATFKPGDPVRERETEREMVVEGYDADGRVVCSFWQGVARIFAPYLEAELVKIPLPW